MSSTIEDILRQTDCEPQMAIQSAITSQANA